MPLNYKQGGKLSGVFMGIDLAAYERRPSGVCIIEGRLATTTRLHKDEEILELAESRKPSVIAIDAPLTSQPRLRKCDLDLIKLGFRVFPPNFSHMRSLSLRAFSLAKKLQSFEVIETFPTAVYRIMGIEKPRRKGEIAGAVRALEAATGISFTEAPGSVDELDSFVCAVVAMRKREGRAVPYGDSTGIIYLPEP